MKTLNKYLVLLLTVLLFGACTDNFEDINDPKTGANTMEPGPLFTRSLVTGSGMSYRIYQLVNQTSTGYWSQHWANIQPAFSGDIFEPSPGNGIWDYYYAKKYFAPLNLNYQAKKILETSDRVNPIQLACTRIWNVYMYSTMTDLYGDIPYSEAIEMNLPKFDKQEDIYTDFFKELNESIVQIEENQALGYPTFGTADVLFEGNIQQWIQFANSLKLRLAMRMSNVEPAVAQNIISEISLDQLILRNVDNVKIMAETAENAVTHDTKNPLGFVYVWNEVRGSTLLVDNMKFEDGTTDPRLPRYLEPNIDGEFVGLDNGQSIADLNLGYDDHYKPNFCNIGPAFNSQAEEVAFHLISASEVNFLLAEAALKGWVAGSASEYYLAGIDASMEQFEVTDQAAIDTFKAHQNIQFNSANALEQIMTQKWVALFTNEVQAWCDMRRTGFPEPIAPVFNFPGNETMPRRIPYPTAEINYNSNNYQEAVNRMGGDTQYTRMWWDVN
ncbi:SusD/RagB family nutrient-binding outer membrane lipoprotein [Sediminitomix flava]|uniref:SusD-like starch-binding protein associating with outer membrane n=1 Tax=Sediminitomix flava TaxID=379075 RepID=A0A315ZEQ7_SEDFL|nr:SusD/RagB family nutrient-binding outer membrane lipoprotein [Sediminitomix flava]PWJ43812.1 SusD-like starch-binding protein associating with outer membrane [Sediminitomix flava]